MMDYSDKVQATINSAHDTAIANKILDMMQDLLQKMMRIQLADGFGS